MEDSQIALPASFVALHTPPGRVRPTQSLQQLAQRWELCDDMAQMLTESASQALVMLGISEGDVLRKMLQGLGGGDAGLQGDEALWVVCRLAELLGWPVSQSLGLDQSELAQHWLQQQLSQPH